MLKASNSYSSKRRAPSPPLGSSAEQRNGSSYFPNGIPVSYTNFDGQSKKRSLGNLENVREEFSNLKLNGNSKSAGLTDFDYGRPSLTKSNSVIQAPPRPPPPVTKFDLNSLISNNQNSTDSKRSNLQNKIEQGIGLPPTPKVHVRLFI